MPKIIGRSTFWIFLPGFFTQSTFLLCSLVLSAWLKKGHMAAFGFTKGAFRLRAAFFLRLLPMLVISTLQVLGSPAGEPSNAAAHEVIGTPAGIILTVCSSCITIYTYLVK